MSNYLQAHRPLAVYTPLGEDVLLLVGFYGQESISQLFNFHLDLLAENRKDVAFNRLLGQGITIRLELGGDKNRYFHGICNRVSQGSRDEFFTHFRMEIAPRFWFFTRKAQSRIFQHLSVPDILKKVLQGLDVAFELQGTFEPRDFCVQYRETDFNFASRLMEEEGIYYFFKHSADGHKMVVANTPQSHADMPEMSNIVYEELIAGRREEMRIHQWEKVQELRSGKYTLWDHCFELPHKHLEADDLIVPEVQVGEVNHKLLVGGNNTLEIYDYPGYYAQRFDGVDKGGGEQPAEVQKIFQDNKRTVKIRMQQEALPSLVIQGASDCRQFVTGHKFSLVRHFDGDGDYLLTSVSHSARFTADYRSGEGDFGYENSFTCIPLAIPYRPRMVTPKPVVQGTQTAVVVGPAGEEIFTDKYGRVKVQFHWDREGKHDADSSCWVRVAQPWAGKRWGAFFWPRIGQEVVIDFLEGDPDQPIIVGSVYNADQMPPYLGQGPDDKHPNDNKLSGVKTNSTKGGVGFNEMRFDDTKSEEQIFIHAERNMDTRVKNDSMERVVGNRHLIVGWEKDGQMGGDQLEQVYQDKHLNVKRHYIEHIEGNMELLVKGNDGGNQDISIEKSKKETIGGDSDLHVKQNRKEKIDGGTSLTVGGDQQEKVGQKHALDAGLEIHLKAGMKVIIEAGVQLSLKGPGGFVDIGPAGVTIQGIMVLINSGGAAGSGSGSSPAAPEDAKEAQPTEPTTADDAKTGQKSSPG